MGEVETLRSHWSSCLWNLNSNHWWLTSVVALEAYWIHYCKFTSVLKGNCKLDHILFMNSVVIKFVL
uniref:Uncharacterized protein n=1 Tax=Helianthus annuus TaxID=4232 RepID=A0A251RZ34_HELAN